MADVSGQLRRARRPLQGQALPEERLSEARRSCSAGYARRTTACRAHPTQSERLGVRRTRRYLPGWQARPAAAARRSPPSKARTWSQARRAPRGRAPQPEAISLLPGRGRQPLTITTHTCRDSSDLRLRCRQGQRPAASPPPLSPSGIPGRKRCEPTRARSEELGGGGWACGERERADRRPEEDPTALAPRPSAPKSRQQRSGGHRQRFLTWPDGCAPERGLQLMEAAAGHAPGEGPARRGRGFRRCRR